jgi:hypothetical protein
MTTEEIRLSALGTIELTKQTELNTIYQKIKEASENGLKSIEVDDINLSNIVKLEEDNFSVTRVFTLIRVKLNELLWFTCYYKIEWDF